MPVLARSLEKAGLSTVFVTMMPVWAEKIGVPRTLAVEFPFGQTLGQAGNEAQQLGVIKQALKVLESTDKPGSIIESDSKWPVPVPEATKSWQPEKPSPVISVLAPRIRTLLREHRQSKSQ